ncbi:hypothetical protein T4D_6078 [Trichinella pseudospiralis]|uniref:Uncharacterized protein n=1 Tax=Trichinella pseudospiralis TaxID=6337 RepID=A0A0V1F7P6_TRIPS|nr:hypothetical protein T4D_6078 [Trichinella pseudospiralis]
MIQECEFIFTIPFKVLKKGPTCENKATHAAMSKKYTSILPTTRCSQPILVTQPTAAIHLVRNDAS